TKRGFVPVVSTSQTRIEMQRSTVTVDSSFSFSVRIATACARALPLPIVRLLSLRRFRAAGILREILRVGVQNSVSLKNDVVRKHAAGGTGARANRLEKLRPRLALEHDPFREYRDEIRVPARERERLSDGRRADRVENLLREDRFLSPRSCARAAGHSDSPAERQMAVIEDAGARE